MPGRPGGADNGRVHEFSYNGLGWPTGVTATFSPPIAHGAPFERATTISYAFGGGTEPAVSDGDGNSCSEST